jgi:hypothetical protein
MRRACLRSPTPTLTVLASVVFAFTTYMVVSPYHRHLTDLLSLRNTAAEGVKSQSIIRANLEKRVKNLESIISGDLYKIKSFVSSSNQKTSNSPVRHKNVLKQTKSSINIFLRATQSGFRSLHSLKKEHQQLERWSEALNQQMTMQCLSIAQQSAGGSDLVDAVRRCEERIKRRAQRRLPSHKMDKGYARGTLQSTRRGTGRPSHTTFVQLKSYKPVFVDKVPSSSIGRSNPFDPTAHPIACTSARTDKQAADSAAGAQAGAHGAEVLFLRGPRVGQRRAVGQGWQRHPTRAARPQGERGGGGALSATCSS